MLKTFLKAFNTIFPFSDFLYILQLEEYDNARYFKTLSRFFLRRNIQKRDFLKFTSRIQTTFILSAGMFLLMVSLLAFVNLKRAILVLPLSVPLLILTANILLTPFYEYMKYRLQVKASKYTEDHSHLTIIAIAGSYGKTTTKNFLYELLRYSYKTQMVPGNINTPTGIAAWLLKNLEKSTRILLVEMDTYFVGEIKRSCTITPPDISIITSIGDQHLERFGSKRKMSEAILEVFSCAKKDSKLFMFDDDINTVFRLGISIPDSVQRIKTEKLKYKTNIISDSALKDLLMAISVAEKFSIPDDIFKDTLMHLSHPDRRQKNTVINGYTAIDDSYNISFTTACAAVDELVNLGKHKHKKTIVITAGIPELGPENKDANERYAKYLEENTDQVFILNSIYRKELSIVNSIVTNNLNETWQIISNKFPASKYIVLIQPELTDLYYSK